MKILLYILILVGVMSLQVKGTDVGKLIPVEVVAISEERGIITVNTDTGDAGSGEGLQEAIDDLKAGAPGIIYLDTAEYLLLEQDMESHLDTVRGHLKQEVGICYARAGIPLEGIADFLSVHKPAATLRTVAAVHEIQTITEENGRYRIAGK